MYFSILEGRNIIIIIIIFWIIIIIVFSYTIVMWVILKAFFCLCLLR